MLVALERPVRMDPRLDAELRGPELDGVVDPLGELLLGVLVGVGRAFALTESAEGTSDRADVGDVDVAVDDERDGVPTSSERSPSAAARISSITSGRCSANSAVSSSAVSSSPREPLSIARPAASGPTLTSPRRPEPRRGMNDQ
jgi:hypothetical protein